jgi:transcriptional regulator with XRE-family HTH domain/tetratricopeptide (TPR) repeat protein
MTGRHPRSCSRQIRERLVGASRWQVAGAIHQHCGVTLLKAHRLARDWTLEQVADRVCVICEESGLGRPLLTAQRVSHWESGREAPSAKYLDALCRLYRTRPDRLGFGHDYSDDADEPAPVLAVPAMPHVPLIEEAGPGIPLRPETGPCRATGRARDPVAQPLVVLPGGGVGRHGEDIDDVNRRAVLQNILVGAGVSLSAPLLEAIDTVRRRTDEALDSGSVSASTLDRWEEAAGHYGQAYMKVPPLRLLGDVVLDFSEIQRLAARRQPLDYQRRLCQVTAQLAGMTGILLIDLGDHRQARAWFHTAKLAADETGDRALRAWVPARESVLPLYYGDPAAAVALARQSRAIAGSTPCPAVTMAAAVEARAHARLGRRGEAEAALRQAEHAFARQPGTAPADTAFGYTERQLRFHAGSALTSLGEPDRAREHHDEALRLYAGAREALDTALIALERAIGLVGSDVQAGCRQACTVLEGLHPEHRTEIVLSKAREVLNAVPDRGRDEPAAREFTEYLALSVPA